MCVYTLLLGGVWAHLRCILSLEIGVCGDPWWIVSGVGRKELCESCPEGCTAVEGSGHVEGVWVSSNHKRAQNALWCRGYGGFLMQKFGAHPSILLPQDLGLGLWVSWGPTQASWPYKRQQHRAQLRAGVWTAPPPVPVTPISDPGGSEPQTQQDSPRGGH